VPKARSGSVLEPRRYDKQLQAWPVALLAASAVLLTLACLYALWHLIVVAIGGGPDARYRVWVYTPVLVARLCGLLAVVVGLPVVNRLPWRIKIVATVSVLLVAVVAVTLGAEASVRRRDIGPRLVAALERLQRPGDVLVAFEPRLMTDDGAVADGHSAMPEAEALWRAKGAVFACGAMASTFDAQRGWEPTPGLCGWHRTSGDIIIRVSLIPSTPAHAGEVSVTAVPIVMGYFT
jgi:hypothetical protein